MRLHALREELLRALCSPMNQMTFQQARGRHPALACASGPLALVEMLGKDSHASFVQKDTVLRALVHEAQNSPWPRLWMTVITCAMVPALVGLRGRLWSGSERPDDLDSLLLLALQETVTGYPLQRRPGSVAAGLKWDTWKRTIRQVARTEGERVFLHGLAARAEVLAEPGADHFEPSEHMGPRREAPTWDEDDLAEMRAVLDALVAGGTTSRQDAEIIWGTRILGRSLAHLARGAAGPGATSPSREQERIRRRRSRAEKKVLASLGRTPRPRAPRPARRAALAV